MCCCASLRSLAGAQRHDCTSLMPLPSGIVMSRWVRTLARKIKMQQQEYTANVRKPECGHFLTLSETNCSAKELNIRNIKKEVSQAACLVLGRERHNHRCRHACATHFTEKERETTSGRVREIDPSCTHSQLARKGVGVLRTCREASILERREAAETLQGSARSRSRPSSSAVGYTVAPKRGA